MKTVFFLCLLQILFHPAVAKACDGCNALSMIAMEYKIVDDRIYLDPTQLLITSEGIYFFVNGQQTFTEKSCLG